MPRIPRIDVANNIYHVLNRASARLQIFRSSEDYKMFEIILEEGLSRFEIDLLAYCIMPNHWHLVLRPTKDGELSRFMGWVTNTHTRRWHTSKGTIGEGHLYQGRYKSFMCQEDGHFMILVRYVERNALKANLVRRAEDWKWSSVWRREYGTPQQKGILGMWPVQEPDDYIDYLNQPQTESEIESLQRSIAKNVPFGNENWRDTIIKEYRLGQVLRDPGRPKNGG